jgi:hypothetical protein
VSEQDAGPIGGGDPGGPRPPKPPKTSISVRFELPLVEELRRLAYEQHRSFNGTVNEACKRYVRQMRSRAQRDGRDAR